MPNPEMHGQRHHSSRHGLSHGKEIENEICSVSYTWFCCNCGEGPLGTETSDQCCNCQHLRCRDCLLGQWTERNQTKAPLSSERSLLGSHLDDFLNIPTLAADDEESDEDDGNVLAVVLNEGSKPVFGENRRPASSDGLPGVDYMIVAERGLGLGLCYYEDTEDEDAGSLGVLTPGSLDADMGEAASDWISKIFSTPAVNMIPQLEQAARWRYGKVEVENNFENYTARLQDPEDFPLVWHHAILPSLVQKQRTSYMQRRIGTDFTVVVLRGKDPKQRKISIMTEKPASGADQSTISEHIIALFPTQFRSALTPESFSYRTGSVSRMTLVRGTSEGYLDNICDPLNRLWYTEPRMGDSVGVALGLGDDESTSTLGPCLSIGKEDFWLLNFHPFADAREAMRLICDRITLEHPSPTDRALCVDAGHGTSSQYSKTDFTLGELMLHLNSGPAYKTTQVSKEPYWHDSMLCPVELVTDWTLCAASGPRVNILRTPPGAERHDERPITCTSHIKPGASIRSTGRTSGLQFGQIGLCPAFVTGGRNGNRTGHDTYEWFIEQQPADDDEERWIRGGIGISGDSGAGVVDDDTHPLYGHVWGRNKYCGEGERVTYFTPILDVFSDIQEKLLSVPRSATLLPCTSKSQQPPRLRQCEKDLDVIPSWPMCLACAESPQQTASPSPSNTSEPGVKGSPVASDQATAGENDILTPVETSSATWQSSESPLADDSYPSLPSPIIRSLSHFEGLRGTQRADEAHSNTEAIYAQDILDDEIFGEDFHLFRSNARRRKRKLSAPDAFARKNSKMSNQAPAVITPVEAR